MNIIKWEASMISYRDVPYSQISVIKDLWDRNRKYHEDLSKHFGSIYSNLVFEDRMKPFGQFDKEHIKITIAENSHDKKIIGYCISTYEGSEGETQTLHVAEEARGTGIGKNLMNSHLKWMKDSGCTAVNITVAFENSNTIEFYRSLGFRENTIEMRLE